VDEPLESVAKGRADWEKRLKDEICSLADERDHPLISIRGEDDESFGDSSGGENYIFTKDDFFESLTSLQNKNSTG
jgi:hypothetical protein